MPESSPPHRGRGRPQQPSECSVLEPDAPAHFGVRGRRERHQLVPRQVDAGQQPLQSMLDPLRQAEHRRGDLVAHLDEVVEGHRGDRLGVLPSTALEQRQGRGPVAAGLVEAAVELDDVLERGSWRPARRTGRWRGRRRRAGRPDHRRATARRGRCRAARRGCAGSRRRASARAARSRGSCVRKCRSIAAGLLSAAKHPVPPLGQNSVHVNERSGLGRAIIIDEPRGQMCSAPGSRANSPSLRRDVQLLVAVVEEVEALVERRRRRAVGRARPSLRRRRRSRRRRRRGPCRAASRTSARRSPGRARRADGRSSDLDAGVRTRRRRAGRG